mmetsp:Transcript_18620/g.34688  ORF Transcript_18620/g.34688 Transcript_18620/m.34688 type:complete len:208 (+) Transcript_18620:130-753(+)
MGEATAIIATSAAGTKAPCMPNRFCAKREPKPPTAKLRTVQSVNKVFFRAGVLPPKMDTRRYWPSTIPASVMPPAVCVERIGTALNLLVIAFCKPWENDMSCRARKAFDFFRAAPRARSPAETSNAGEKRPSTKASPSRLPAPATMPPLIYVIQRATNFLESMPSMRPIFIVVPDVYPGGEPSSTRAMPFTMPDSAVRIPPAMQIRP